MATATGITLVHDPVMDPKSIAAFNTDAF